MAEKGFTSDLIVWSGSFNKCGFRLKAAYASLKQDEVVIKEYLNLKDIVYSSVFFGAVI